MSSSFGEGNGSPLQYSCLENSMDSLVGCSPWGCEVSDTIERLPFHFSLSCIGERNGNPLQCSCLENPRDGGIWWASVYGVAQSWTQLMQLSSSSPILCDLVDHSTPGSSVHEIYQARIQEWFAISFSRVSSCPRDQTRISCIGRRVLYH